jgi:hypothetical protein
VAVVVLIAAERRGSRCSSRREAFTHRGTS